MVSQEEGWSREGDEAKSITHERKWKTGDDVHTMQWREGEGESLEANSLVWI